MNENAVMILLGISAVSTTISGFSGVVAVFGSREDGKWAPDVRFRTTNMLILSLGACLMSFVPLTEELFQIPEEILWITSSLMLLAFCIFFFIHTAIRIRKPDLRKPKMLIAWVGVVYFICLALAIVFQAFNVAGIFIARGPGAFIAGLLFVLIPAGLQFAYLVLTPLTANF